jgi:hypothetical protein
MRADPEFGRNGCSGYLTVALLGMAADEEVGRIFSTLSRLSHGSSTMACAERGADVCYWEVIGGKRYHDAPRRGSASRPLDQLTINNDHSGFSDFDAACPALVPDG